MTKNKALSNLGINYDVLKSSSKYTTNHFFFQTRLASFVQQ